MDCILAVLSSTLLFLAAFTLNYEVKQIFYAGFGRIGIRGMWE